MTKTVAGRYGAISGFGLSVVKWILILKVMTSQSAILSVPYGDQALLSYLLVS